MPIFCLCVKRALTTPTQTRQLHMLAAGPHFSRCGRDNCGQRRLCTSHATDEVPQTPSVDPTIASPTCTTAHPYTTHFPDAPFKMFELTHLPNSLGVAPPDIQRFENISQPFRPLSSMGYLTMHLQPCPSHVLYVRLSARHLPWNSADFARNASCAR